MKLTARNANAFASTFYFFANTEAIAKKIKRACKPTHKTTEDSANLTQQTLDRKEQRTANSGYKKLAVQWLHDVLCFVSSSVLADSFVLRNRQLLVAAKR
jgi:hypothetical protein